MAFEGGLGYSPPGGVGGPDRWAAFPGERIICVPKPVGLLDMPGPVFWVWDFMK